jgi:putative ABC transport system substrate-binding protein
VITRMEQRAGSRAQKCSRKLTRIGVLTLCAMLYALCSSAAARQPKQVPRIGYLSGGSAASPDQSRINAFRQGLGELGYVEGKNIIIEYRFADEKYERLPGLAAELVRLNVDILVVRGAPAAHAAKNATRTIPIIIGNAADPVGTGSLAAPGGNITGLSDYNSGVITRRLELLKEVVPTASGIAAVLNPANPTNRPQLKEIQSVAPAVGVTLLSLEVRGGDDIERAFATMKKKRVGAIFIVGGAASGNHQRRFVELAAKNRLPTSWSSTTAVEAGGLMSYGTNFADLYRRAAIFVDKILKGAKPADLPVEQPTKFELVINLKTAKQIGLTIPPNVLARADKVIK